jgi:phosphoribosyl 1,2-cyclic phosphate phosphodiesterase
MRITFLGSGTSQGIPVIGSQHPVCLSKDSKDKRLRASVYVETDSLKLIIDCGPDFRTQILRENISDLEAILFTHEHSDHTAGLDDIRQFTLKDGALPIYAHQRVLTNLEKRFDYIFDKSIIYKGKPEVIPNTIENSPFYINNQKIIPIDMLHGELQTFGFRIDDFAYLTDVSFIPKKEKEKLQNLKILIVDTLRIRPHPTHFNLEDSLDLIKELKPERTYFTHISHKLGFHEKVQKSLPKNVFLGYDGLKLKTTVC